MNNKIYVKKCEQCGNDIFYKTAITLKISLRNNTKCYSCASFNRMEKLKEDPIKLEEYKQKFTGVNNPYYGKKHTEEIKAKIKEKRKVQTNLRTGKINNYQVWLNKYGLEEANNRHKAFKDKISSKMCGENNPMYGKAIPMKS